MAHHQYHKPLQSVTPDDIEAHGISANAAAQLHRKLNEIVATHGADAAMTWQHISQNLLIPDLPFSFHQMMYYGCFINFGPDPPAWLPDPDAAKLTNIGKLLERRGKELLGSSYKDPILSFSDFQEFSVSNFEIYWKIILEEMNISFSVSPECILRETPLHPGGQWLPGARFNPAKNCLSLNGKRSLSDIVVVTRSEGDDEAPVTKLTLGELRSEVWRVAYALDTFGLEKGSTIAIDMPMDINSVVVYLAIILAGYIVVSIADSFTANEISTRLMISKAKAIFTQDFISRGGKKLPLYSKVIDAQSPLAIVIPSRSSTLSIKLRDGDISWHEFLERVDESDIYKIISKVLTERLKRVIGKLVSGNQNAFLKGKQLADAVLVADECIDHYLKNKRAAVICKLDMEKAFDSVNWEFLFKLMSMMGFGDKWVQWIRFCVTTVRISIIINGSPEGFFPTQRGLRQGDPLSPYLFILVMEVLSLMLRKATELSWIDGFDIRGRDGNNLVVSHILYADDILVLCSADESQLLHLKAILLAFESITGLHVNWSKSSIFSINADHKIHELAAILCCKIETFPSTYLGMPLGARFKDSSVWQGVIEKCERKLAPWKKQYISFGGRLTLINSVLDGIPTHTMSLFPIPVKVEKQLDKIRRNFLWEGNQDRRKFHLVKWESITRDKKFGGLGIKNLKLQNKSLLLKWHWRFNDTSNDLWKNVITIKYRKSEEWCTNCVKGPHGVSVWKHIRGLWDEFFDSIRLKIGNGRRVKLWADRWLDDIPLKEQFPDLYEICLQKNCTVADCYSTGGWDLHLRRSLHDWEIDSICALIQKLDLVLLKDQETDSLIWKLKKDGKFVVNACYKNLLRRTGVDQDSWPWKIIWKTIAPPRAACFTWIATHEACLTHDNLQKRGFNLCSRCLLCEEDNESVNHLLLHCNFTRQIWVMFLTIFGVQWVMPSSIKLALSSWYGQLSYVENKHYWKAIPTCIFWNIWQERNNRCFNDKRENILHVKSKCLKNLYFWHKKSIVSDLVSLSDLLFSFNL